MWHLSRCSAPLPLFSLLHCVIGDRSVAVGLSAVLQDTTNRRRARGRKRGALMLPLFEQLAKRRNAKISLLVYICLLSFILACLDRFHGMKCRVILFWARALLCNDRQSPGSPPWIGCFSPVSASINGECRRAAAVVTFKFTSLHI